MGADSAPAAAPADAVQPGADGLEGQGGEATSGLGLYDLADAPEELRPHIERELKKIEGNVTRKFQEAATTRERVAALEEAGIPADMPPEEVQQMVGMFQTLSDPQQFEDFWYRAGEELGFFVEGDEEGQPGIEGQPPAPASDQSVDAIASKVLEQIDARLSPIEAQMAERDQEARELEAAEQIRQELSDLHEQYGDFDEDAVCELALNYDGDDALERGYQRLQEILGQNEKGWFQQREGAPRDRSEGQPDTAAKPVVEFGEAKRLAKERFAGAR